MSYTIRTHADGTPWGTLDTPHPVSGYTVVTPTVVLEGWSFATMFPSSDHTLEHEVLAHNIEDGGHHYLHGQRFATSDDARRAAYEAGILGYFVRGDA